MWVKGCIRPSDTNPKYMGRSGASLHRLGFRVIGETHAELVVDSPPVLYRGTSEGLSEIAELADQCSDLELAHRVSGRSVAQLPFETLALLLDFGDPATDDCDVWLGLEQFPGHCCVVRSLDTPDLASANGWSDCFGEFVEGCHESEVLVRGVGSELVVATAWVLDEGVTSDHS